MKVGFILLCIGFSVPSLAHTQRTPPQNKDYDIWFEVGQRVIHGESLYPEEGNEQYGYMYPPTLAIFVFAPLSVLGYTVFVSAFVLGNSLVWYFTMQLGFHLFAGSARRQPTVVFLLPFAATVGYVYDTFLLGQVNLVLLLLMFLMFSMLRSGKPWLAGGLLALAAAMKAFPLSALAYLVYRRHWKAAIATVAGLILFLVILPAPFRGLERNACELSLWYRGMLADQSGNSIGQRSDSGFTYKNQSVIAAIHRLTRPVVAGDYDGTPFRVNLLDLTPPQSQLAAYGLILALGLSYVGFMPDRKRQTTVSLRCEEAMLLLLVVVCSPLAWTYFFCWTLPAWIVAVQRLTVGLADASDRRRGWIALGIVGAVMFTSVTQHFDQSAQAVAVTLWGSLGLFGILGWLMRKSVATLEVLPPHKIEAAAETGVPAPFGQNAIRSQPASPKEQAATVLEWHPPE